MWLCVHVAMCPCVYVSVGICVLVYRWPCVYVSVDLCVHVSMCPCVYDVNDLMVLYYMDRNNDTGYSSKTENVKKVMNG